MSELVQRREGEEYGQKKEMIDMEKETNGNAQQSIVPLNLQDKPVQIRSHYKVRTCFMSVREGTYTSKPI